MLYLIILLVCSVLIITVLLLVNKDPYIRILPPFTDEVQYGKFYIVNTPLEKLKLPVTTEMRQLAKRNKLDMNLSPIFIYNPKYFCPVQDQGQCGACWAFVIASMLSDQITTAIIKFGKPLSVQELLTCYPNTDGCEGAVPEDVLLWLEKSQLGISVSDQYIPVDRGECLKYENNGITVAKNSVVTLCTYIEEENTVKYSKILEDNIYNMKTHIMSYGPIYSVISIYSDFIHFDGNSVYIKKSNRFIGGHAVEIIGWCDPGIDKRKGYDMGYWVCKNSWGTQWSHNFTFPGYFAIRMGTNECGIESRTGGAYPNVEYITRSLTNPGILAITSYKDYLNIVIRKVKCTKNFCLY